MKTFNFGDRVRLHHGIKFSPKAMKRSGSVACGNHQTPHGGIVVTVLWDGLKRARNIPPNFLKFDKGIASGKAVRGVSLIDEPHYRNLDLDDAGWESLLKTVEQARAPIRARQTVAPAKCAEVQTQPSSVGELYIDCELEVFFDGCTEPRNPGGHCGYGVLIRVRDSKEILTGISGYIPPAPSTSNNVGEYSALLAAFKWLREAGLQGNSIHFWGDSKLVINQVWGDWRINAGFYVPLAHQAKKEVPDFPRAVGQWIPREENSPADELSKAELVRRGVVFRIQPRG